MGTKYFIAILLLWIALDYNSFAQENLIYNQILLGKEWRC